MVRIDAELEAIKRNPRCWTSGGFCNCAAGRGTGPSAKKGSGRSGVFFKAPRAFTPPASSPSAFPNLTRSSNHHSG